MAKPSLKGLNSDRYGYRLDLAAFPSSDSALSTAFSTLLFDWSYVESFSHVQNHNCLQTHGSYQMQRAVHCMIQLDLVCHTRLDGL